MAKAKRYVFQFDYVSSTIGPYKKGAVVELSADEVDWLLRDSPGCVKVERGGGKGKKAAKTE